MSTARSGKGTSSLWTTLLRWGTAALVVATAHGGMAWFALSWRPNEAAAGAPEPAIMIELAAVSVAPEAPPEELPPAPQATEVEPPPPEPPEPVKEPDPPPESEIEPEPVQVPEPEIKLPELPQLPDPAAVLAPPPPPPPKRIERKPPPPKQRVVERKVERERPRAKRAAAPPPSTAPAAAPSAAPAGAAARPSVSTASWRGMLIAHLNRYKRFPGGASPGTVQVAFSIDQSGRVISARLAGSSGDPVLDQEAVSMVRRASPVPAPPDGLGRGAISLAVPVRYNR
ncbi:energy transducer TonB family protein [Bosea sp. (in: a-proteobacteria)]|jgi:protein TonB|uniref:energy transducer TonB family protein n=1 Tax=Bosea sp. (in: a-proteobacteria) TaxID=1871050 RepID=UPI003F6F8392